MNDTATETDANAPVPVGGETGADSVNDATEAVATADDGGGDGGDGGAGAAGGGAPPAGAPDMGQEIEQLKAQIKAADEAKARLQLLQPLYDKKAKSQADYVARRPGLLETWQRQRCELLHDVKQVAAEQPDWVRIIRANICAPLDSIRAEQTEVAKLQQELVLLKASADAIDTPVKQAKRAETEADELQKAWMDISGSLAKRLQDFDTRRGQLKKSPAPISDPANLYILFFDLLPDLLAVAPTDAPNDVRELTQVRDKVPCQPLVAKPPPRLVTVAELSAAQDAAWAAFVAAQAAHAQAGKDVTDKAAALEKAQADLAKHIANLSTVQPAAQPAAAA